METAVNVATPCKTTRKARSSIFHGVFTTSTVLKEISPSLLNPRSCRLWIIRQLHPRGAFCPSCHKPVSERSLPKFLNNEKVKCSECGKFFTALTGTFIAGTHMDFAEIFFLSLCLEIGLSAKSIADRMGLDPDTVRLWRDRFRLIKTSTRS